MIAETFVLYPYTRRTSEQRHRAASPPAREIAMRAAARRRGGQVTNR